MIIDIINCVRSPLIGILCIANNNSDIQENHPHGKTEEDARVIDWTVINIDLVKIWVSRCTDKNKVCIL